MASLNSFLNRIKNADPEFFNQIVQDELGQNVTVPVEGFSVGEFLAEISVVPGLKALTSARRAKKGVEGVTGGEEIIEEVGELGINPRTGSEFLADKIKDEAIKKRVNKVAEDVSTRFGTDYDDARKTKALQEYEDALRSGSTSKLIKFYNKYKAPIIAIGGMGFITHWQAQDNVLTGVGINAGRIPSLVESGAMSKEDANAEIDLLEKEFKIARFSTYVSYGANPLNLIAYPIDRANERNQETALEIARERVKVADAERKQLKLNAQEVRDKKTLGMEQEPMSFLDPNEEMINQSLPEKSKLTQEQLNAAALSEATSSNEGPNAIIADPVTGRMMTRSRVQHLQRQREEQRKQAAQRRSEAAKPRTSGGFAGVRQSQVARGSPEKKIKGVV
jgi:hypothetical protein